MQRKLDSVDIAILRELQSDGNITNVELSRRVGLSAPPCLRRVRALENDGIITAYRAVLNPKSLGFEVVSFAMVQLNSQGKADLDAFQEAISNLPTVRRAWSLSGETDFLLFCVSPNLTAFQEFVLNLTGLPNVRVVRSALCLEHVKDEPFVPLDKVQGAKPASETPGTRP
ncbi:MAG: Lrp/AsnC family transcriptional regulator [Methylobacteriaceae bacterium]|jgi:DNA-binding Lrp family transcriptional regulator|nr:Lrp/AsnC family transcriptional regulator [Methylobacteriaceae bacterium]